MFNRKKREDVLGIGSVRAPIKNEPAEINTEPVKTKPEVEEVTETIAETITETFEEIANSSTLDTPIDQDSLESLSWETSVVMETDSQQKLLDQLERQIQSLEKQLEAKDQQLASKDDIIKNFQVLLKVEQDTVLRLAMSPAKPKFKFSWWKNEPSE